MQIRESSRVDEWYQRFYFGSVSAQDEMDNVRRKIAEEKTLRDEAENDDEECEHSRNVQDLEEYLEVLEELETPKDDKPTYKDLLFGGWLD